MFPGKAKDPPYNVGTMTKIRTWVFAIFLVAGCATPHRAPSSVGVSISTSPEGRITVRSTGEVQADTSDLRLTLVVNEGQPMSLTILGTSGDYRSLWGCAPAPSAVWINGVRRPTIEAWRELSARDSRFVLSETSTADSSKPSEATSQ